MNPQDFAQALLDARKAGRPIPFPKAGPPPSTEAEAYTVQALVIAGLGGRIGGWKVGAAGPDAAPNCAPLPQGGLLADGAMLPTADYPQREVESEIAFRLVRDLAPRAAAYGRDEILAAIGDCLPVLEIVQSRFADPDQAGPLAHLADFIQHGALICGAPIQDWRDADMTAWNVVQRLGGDRPKQSTGNPAGDMIRLVAWLADRGAVWAGGLRAGQIVTCGSWTGKTRAASGAAISARFESASPVQARFA